LRGEVWCEYLKLTERVVREDELPKRQYLQPNTTDSTATNAVTITTVTTITATKAKSIKSKILENNVTILN